MLNGNKKTIAIILNFYVIVNNFFYTIIVTKLQFDNELENKKIVI